MMTQNKVNLNSADTIHKKSAVLDQAKSEFMKKKMNSYLDIAKEAVDSNELT